MYHDVEGGHRAYHMDVKMNMTNVARSRNDEDIGEFVPDV